MEILRIDSYCDPRFPQDILWQHGAYLAGGQPVAFRVISDHEAVISAPAAVLEALDEIVETFRFHAEHITVFYDETGNCLLRLPDVERREIAIDSLQPSQFSVDREKCAAVGHFIRTAADLMIPVMALPEGGVCVLDGHTRLYEAWRRGLRTAMVFHCDMPPEAQKTMLNFVREAQKRKIYHIRDMAVYSPEEQKIRWHDWCSAYFSALEESSN